MDNNTKTLEAIFTREIGRLNDMSEERALTIEEVDVLLKLVKAHASFKERNKDDLDGYDDVPTEKLEELLHDS